MLSTVTQLRPPEQRPRGPNQGPVAGLVGPVSAAAAVDLDAIVADAVLAGQLAGGRSRRVMAGEHGARAVVVQANRGGRRSRLVRWTEPENDFLRENLGRLSEADLAAVLGRTVVAVHNQWHDKLRLAPPSKRPEFEVTGQRIADMLAVDSHSVMLWLRRGQLPFRLLPCRGRRIHLVPRLAFEQWVVNPANWPYFKPERIADPRLRALVARQAERWGDEWWTVGQCARHHHVAQRLVGKHITDGLLPAVDAGNYRIRRSDVVAHQFVTGKTRAWSERRWPPAANAFLITAAALGFSHRTIARLMGRGADDDGETVRLHLKMLERNGLVRGIIVQHALKVSYDARRGLLAADWRDHRDQFRRLARTMERLASRGRLTIAERCDALGVLRSLARWHARTPAQKVLAKALYTLGRRDEYHLLAAAEELAGWGVSAW